MKKILYSAIFIAVTSCGGHSHSDAVSQHEHTHIHSYTAYTEGAEFFLQHEGLDAGKKSCITLYVTDLETFKPADCESVEATLAVDGKSLQATAKAGKKGVFHFDFTPETAGEGMLYLNAGGEKAHFEVEVHDIHSECEGHTHGGHHDMHAHEHEHEHGHDHSHAEEAHGHSHSHKPHAGHGIPTDGKPGDITFSKEQSWKIDFATAVAKKSSFDGVVKVAAKVEAAPGNFTTIVAATSGKVQFAGNLVDGKEVNDGEPLFYLEGSDVTDNDAAVKYAEAESSYNVAKADYERKKSLFIDMIVSEREYQAAEAAYLRAKARYESMQRSFGDGKVCLRSPMKGYVAAMLVENGDYVQPGTPLATVQRDGCMNIVAELPVRYAAQLKNIKEVNIEPAPGEVYSLDELGGRILAVGSSVNECNMIPVTLSAGTLKNAVPGSIVKLYMTSRADGAETVVVPRSAIVEEMGSYFVFVQNSPVSFEKRSVVTGNTDGLHVKISSGVHAGERIVTKGAVILKLSQGAAALDPHAGHVH